MKKTPWYIPFSFVLMFSFALGAIAQSPSPTCNEQKKEALKAQLAELELQELAQLKRQVELKTREVKDLQEKNNALQGKNNVKVENKAEVSDKPSSSVSAAEISRQVEENARVKTLPIVNASYVKTEKDLAPSNDFGNKPLSRAAVNRPPLAFTTNCNIDRNTRYKKQLCHWAQDTVTTFNNLGGMFQLTPRDDLLLTLTFGKLLQSKSSIDVVTSKFLTEAEDHRLDKQVGTDSKGSGTTSLVVKGGVPAFLNWAVENGAATSSTSGTTTTFRINPVGFFETVTGSTPVTIEPTYSPNSLLGQLKRTSIGVSFDISRGSNPNVFTGDKQQLAAVSFRYEFVNQRNDYKKNLKALLDGGLADNVVRNQLNAFNSLLNPPGAAGPSTFKNATLEAWRKNMFVAIAALNDASFAGKNDEQKFAAVETAIDQELNKLPVDDLVSQADVIDPLKLFVNTAQDYVMSTQKLLNAARRGHVFTFEYTNNREITASDTSNFRLIYEKNSYFGMDFTLNGSLAFYNKKPAGPDVSRIKDFDFSAQLDLPMTGIEAFKKGILTFAGKYQRVNGDAVALDGTVVPNTKGDIWVGQAKLFIPLAKGVRIPISATFANRTELIKEKEVRGNVGITLDIDTIMKLFKTP